MDGAAELGCVVFKGAALERQVGADASDRAAIVVRVHVILEGAVLYDSLALKANRDRRTLLVLNGGIIHLQLAAGFYVDIVVVISTFCVKGAVFGNEGAALLHIDRAVGQITVCEGGGVPGGNIDDRVGKGHAFRSEIVVVDDRVGNCDLLSHQIRAAANVDLLVIHHVQRAFAFDGAVPAGHFNAAQVHGLAVLQLEAGAVLQLQQRAGFKFGNRRVPFSLLEDQLAAFLNGDAEGIRLIHYVGINGHGLAVDGRKRAAVEHAVRGLTRKDLAIFVQGQIFIVWHDDRFLGILFYLQNGAGIGEGHDDGQVIDVVSGGLGNIQRCTGCNIQIAASKYRTILQFHDAFVGDAG